MPRKAADRVDEGQFHDWIVDAFRRTAPQERFEIARAWCVNFAQPDRLSAALGLAPIVLIVASLIDIQHPLLSCQRPNMSYTAMVRDVLMAELKRLPVAIPCGQPVDNSLKTVDNPVDNSVDNSSRIVDNLQFVHRTMRNG